MLALFSLRSCNSDTDIHHPTVSPLTALMKDQVSKYGAILDALLLVKIVPQTEYCKKITRYSATDTTFIFSHFGLFLSDAASNSHK